MIDQALLDRCLDALGRLRESLVDQLEQLDGLIGQLSRMKHR